VRSRHQNWNTQSALVPVIWLAFYAIAVVGALAWPRQIAATQDLAVVLDDTQQSGAQGKAVWK
jgi:tryptophan-rich sensory protein